MKLARQLAIALILLQFASVHADEPPQSDGDSIVAPLGHWLIQTASDLQREFTPAMGAEFTFKVVDSDGRPVADASVQPWAVGAKRGSFSLPEPKFPAIKTDAAGMVRIVIPAGDDPDLNDFKYLKKDDVNEFALEVRHPDHPAWCKYIDSDGKSPIVLVPSTAVEIRAHLRGDPAPVSRLYPMLASTTNYTDWSQTDGKLILRCIDLASKDEPWRWLRIVYAPEAGTVWFSDSIDLKQETGNPISLDVSLKPGVRVVGHLADDVPRPIKNGRVIATIINGSQLWNHWLWEATTEIAPDGTFELNSLPRDENLQLIALCDGWVSRSPSVNEVKDYVEKNHWHNLNYRGPNAIYVYPQLVHIGGLAANPVIPMEPTAACAVTVIDEHKLPIAGADIYFSPNQTWFDRGSNILGVGKDTLNDIRAELKLGKPEKPRFVRDSRYTAKTDASGKATIANLPVFGDAGAPHEIRFTVSRDGYVPLANAPNAQVQFLSHEPESVVTLAAGQTTPVTIKMKKIP